MCRAIGKYKNVLSDTMGYLDTYMSKMVKINGHFEA